LWHDEQFLNLQSAITLNGIGPSAPFFARSDKLEATPAANNPGPASFEMESQTVIKGWLMRVALSSHVFAPATVKLESLRRLSGRLDVNRTVLSPPFHRSKSTAA